MVEPSKMIFLIEKLYPKRRIESDSIMGTVASPNKNATHVSLLIRAE